MFQLKKSAVFLSDLHVINILDDRYQFLLDFLNHSITNNAEQIFLIGDIFDLMIGNHQEYFILYKDFFNLILKHLLAGKEIFYFQGNHDFHIENLFQMKFRNFNNFHLFDAQAIFNYQNKRIYISHGDELDINNISYQKYKGFIRSNLIKLAANHLVTYNTISMVAKHLANHSKRSQRNFNWDKTFNSYRNIIEKLWNNNIDVVICGHGHVVDAWEEGVKAYYNMGFTAQEKHFLRFDGTFFEFVPI